MSTISKLWKLTFLYYRPGLVRWSWGLKSNAFFPDFCHYFPNIYPCRFAPKLWVKIKFVFSRPFSSLVSLIWGVDYCVVFVQEKNSQHTQNADRVPSVGYQRSSSWHPNLLSGSHVELGFSSAFFFSWLGYCGYTRFKLEMWSKTIEVSVRLSESQKIFVADF